MADILLDTFAGSGWLADHTSDNGLAWVELDGGFADPRLDLVSGSLRWNPASSAGRAAFAVNPGDPGTSPILVPPFSWEAVVTLTGSGGPNRVSIGLIYDNIGVPRVTCGIGVLNANTTVSVGTGDFSTTWNSVSAPTVVAGANTLRVDVDELGFAWFSVNGALVYAALDQSGGIGASYYPGVFAYGNSTVDGLRFFVGDAPGPDAPYTGGWWRNLANSTQEAP